jgi:ArsR family transcriptional regulator, arsenate/arsenite/antimonite-responsive transcriptional repressor
MSKQRQAGPAFPVGCRPPLSAQPLDAEQAGAFAPMFKALGEPVRLRLLSMIASSPEGCVCDLADGFDLTGPTISYHLRILREAGLVAHERRGTWVYYRCRQTVLRQLMDLLAAPAVPAVGEPAVVNTTRPRHET